jgi:hypothetical protein
MPYRKAVITGLLREPVWSCLREKLKFLKYVHTVENGFEVYAHAEEGLREVAWQKLFPGAKVQLVTGSWVDNSSYRMLHAQGRFITLGTPQLKEVLADRRKNMPLTKPLRDESSSGGYDSADERELKRPKLVDEQLAAKAAEVRAAMVVEADAAVVARAAELKLVTARTDMYAGKLELSSSEQSVLEQSVRQAQDEEKVAKARLSLLRAELKALQLK